MYQKFIRNTAVALGTLLVGSTFVMAAPQQGVVTGVDSKGMATVRTSDHKEYQMKIGEGLRLTNLPVQCEMKNNAMECRPVETHAAVAPAPSTAAPAPAKQAPAAAPTTSAPAPSSSTSGSSTSTPAPSTSAPATGSSATGAK